jgi:hypothetical protein
MGEARLHVVFGTGQAANGLTAQPAGLGAAVQAERFPSARRGTLAAAGRAGALLVMLENLYGYGPAKGKAGPSREKEKRSWVSSTRR